MNIDILSGDRRVKVESMARQLHLPEGCCRAEMTPDEKADWIRQLGTTDRSANLKGQLTCPFICLLYLPLQVVGR